MDKKITSNENNDKTESLEWINLSVNDVINDIHNEYDNAKIDLNKNKSDIFMNNPGPDNYDDEIDDYDPDDFDEDIDDFDPDDFDSENIDIDDLDIEIDDNEIDYDDIEINRDEFDKDIVFDSNHKIDKIRERTFNEELSDLVTRIRTNENASDIERTEVDDITPEKLLHKFHELFYRSINLPHLNEINTDFNPFNFIKKSSDMNLEQIIYHEMNSLSMNKYAILTYDIYNKCFSPYINHIDEINENNLVIDLSEQLFSDILNNEKGIFLDNNKISENAFLKKRFTPVINKTENFMIYFLSLNNLFSNLFFEIEGIPEEKASYYPLLIIQLDNKTNIDYKSIYKDIRNRLAPHFLMLEKERLCMEAADINNLYDLYTRMDYIYRSYYRRNEGICFNLKCSNYTNVEIMLILNYFKIKIQKVLSKKSIISRPDINKLLIFVPKNEKIIIDRVLEELITLYNDSFTVDQFINDDNKLTNILENCLIQ